ncbi:MAG: archease [Hyphomicrobiales bacterium]|nr:archease [Hyphomicrobiales bacterium]
MAERKESGWEHFPHGADIGVRGVGVTKAVAFEQAACAMMAVVADLDRIKPQGRIEVLCTAPDDELLLVEWLNALVYEMAVRRMLFSRFAVEIQKNGLRGTAWGEGIDVERHEPAIEIKGATVTAVGVTQGSDGLWLAQCVVDV